MLNWKNKPALLVVVVTAMALVAGFMGGGPGGYGFYW